MPHTARALLYFSLFLAVACTGAKTPDDEVDDDGDGFSEAAGDCDDALVAVFPGADELCDGLDQDCDGITDEEPIDADVRYRDGDLDGWGDPDRPLVDCDPPEGYIAQSGDCDDRDAADHPDANETCDGEDDDCDGEIDEAGATDEPTWYNDADGDGYGVEDDTLVQCDAPEGYAPSSGDCVPDDALVYPGADESDCTEDRSCDGVIGRDDDLDGFTTCTGDCDDTDASASPGLVEVCADGADNDCDGSSNDCGPAGDYALDTAAAWLHGDLLSALPSWIVALGDVNGDGYGEIVLGVELASDAGDGEAVVVPWPQAGEGTLDLASAGILGDETLAAPTLVAVGPGDVDADGRADLLLAQPWPQDSDELGGRVALFLSLSANELSDADYDIRSETSGDRLGAAMAGAGDTDEDGELELWLGAPGGAGTVWLVTESLGTGGWLGRDSTVDQVGSAITGEAEGDAAGNALSSGDLDGDGAIDVLVGAPESAVDGLTLAGRVYVADPALAGGSLADADAVLGDTEGGGLGAVLAAGDVDGDGYADALLGLAQGALLFLGPVSGRASAASADASVSGDGADDAGAALSLGDVDGDGRADLLVGAPGISEAWLYLGPVEGELSPDARFVGTDPGALLGASVALGDLDADGHAEILLGAPAEAEGAGGVYVIAGFGL